MRRPFRRPFRRLLAAGAVAALVVAACSASSDAGSRPSAQPANRNGGPSRAPAAALTVYAAASLEAALAQAAAAYEAANPGTTLTVSTGSSAALETQIEQGAPADVFLSADMANPQKLEDEGLAAGPVVKFAGNRLTVIVPAGNPAAIHSPADLARNGVKIVAAADAVPITKYANRLVDNLAGMAGYPAGFAAKYAANVVSKEDSVAGVVAKIELGEGDAGIVYVTDAKTSSKVATVSVPDAANVPATYGGAVVRASKSQAAAAAFLAWLAGAPGQGFLRTFGFLPPT